jgi:hypothetical protein
VQLQAVLSRGQELDELHSAASSCLLRELLLALVMTRNFNSRLRHVKNKFNHPPSPSYLMQTK